MKMRLSRKSKFPTTIYVNYGDRITYNRVKARDIVETIFAHLNKYKKPRFLKVGKEELVFTKIEEMCKPYVVERWGSELYAKEDYKMFREIAKKSNVLASYKKEFGVVKKKDREKWRITR